MATALVPGVVNFHQHLTAMHIPSLNRLCYRAPLVENYENRIRHLHERETPTSMFSNHASQQLRTKFDFVRNFY